VAGEQVPRKQGLREPDMSLWQGRVDRPETALNQRWHQHVQSYRGGQAGHECAPGIALMGFASDEGVQRNQGRSGARDGPDAVRKALSNCAHHLKVPLYDAGNVACVNNDLEAAQTLWAEQVSGLLSAQQRPLLVGGGHEIAYGSFMGWLDYVQSHGDPSSMAVINFDAHFDLRVEQQATSGTPFVQIAQAMAAHQLPFNYLCLGLAESSNTQALFQTAKQWGVGYCYDWHLRWPNWEVVNRRLCEFASAHRHLYVTIDLDVFPAAVAPGVSAPAMGGVGVDMVESLLLSLNQLHRAGSAQVEMFEVAELNPHCDEGLKTARLAARLIYLGSQFYSGDEFV